MNETFSFGARRLSLPRLALASLLCSFLTKMEMVKRLHMPLAHDLRTLYCDTRLVQRVRDARDILEVLVPTASDVDISFPNKHLAYIDHTLHSKYLLDKLGLFVCWRSTHEQHTKREVRRFIVDLG